MKTEAKIGIGIVHCQSTPGSTNIGFTLVYKSDNGKWSSIIDDTGVVFRYVKIGYETILRMIHFSKDGEGWYMCSMKPIPGRDEEYRASWVYFPSSLDLSQKDIKNVIEVAESQIKHKEFDPNKLQEVIKSYTLCNEVSSRYNVPSVQHGYAFRDTSGDYNLFDLYGCMYQKDFTQYEWVILMEKSLLMFKGDSIEDISNRKILESHVIKPTSNEFGFIPYHNGTEFKSPVRIMEGESLSIEFKKKGYLDVPKTIKSQSDFSISKNDCKKYFKKSQFVALDAKNKNRISHATIKPINAGEDKTGEYWIFAEQNLEIAKFNVMADGYTADSFSLDLKDKSLYDEMPMYLEPESHEYTFILPLDRSIVKDHDSIEVCIHSQFVIRESPFKGYRCSGTPREGRIPNRLTAIQGTTLVNSNTSKSSGGSYGSQEGPNPLPRWKFVKYAVCCILLFGIICVIGGWGCDKYLSDNTYGDENITAGQGDTGSVDESNSPWDIAYGYLKKHNNKILKNDIEKFDDLKELYDILNSYRFNDYVNFIDNHPHREDILQIEAWNRLYEEAKRIGSNKNGVYNLEENEQSITFDNFFKTVSRMANMENENDSEQDNKQRDQKAGRSSGDNKGSKNKPKDQQESQENQSAQESNI